MRDWSPVTRRDRCPVCDGSSWCAVSSDGRVARCMRVVDGPDVIASVDKEKNPYGLRFLDGSTPDAPALTRYQPAPEVPRAEPGELHRVYSKLLDCLALSPAHREALVARGLSHEDIDARGYRTMPPPFERPAVVRALRVALGGGPEAIPRDVPGIHRGRLFGATGLVIPVRDRSGRVQALKIRSDEVDPNERDNRYTWLSSSGRDGPGPGAPCHVPILPGVPQAVRITEGPLKADVATALSGVLTLGVAGCTMIRSAIETLQALRVERVTLAWDADARTNPSVARSLRAAVAILEGAGVSVAIETWDAAQGKGIDDALRAGATITTHTGADVARVVRDTCEAAGADVARVKATAPSAPATPSPPVNVALEVRARGAVAFDRGDSVELAHALLEQLRAAAPDAKGDAVVYDRGSLWQYDPARGIYLERDRADVYRLVSAFAGAPVGPKGKPLALSDGAIKGAAYTVSQLAARPGYLDDAPKGVVFGDRFVTARDGEVVTEPHSHAHRAIHGLAVAYEMDAPRGRWTSMLREVFRRRDEAGLPSDESESDTEKCIELLQEWVGVALMGEATSRAQALVLVGAGNDGKSSVLNIIRALFPPTAVCSIAPQDWARGFLLAGLAGKRLNVVAELPERDILDSERFKAVVDGSPLTAERKNQDPFDLVCEGGHIFACNALPATRDQSKGFWRRFIVLVCERSFDGSEVVRDLWRSIVAEELAGIAAWALEGAARAQSQREFTSPDSSRTAKADWQHESDQVRQFTDEACVALDAKDHPSEESTLADLFVAYRLWCAQSGHPPLARNRLGSRLRGLGLEHRTKAARLYRLRTNAAWLAAAKGAESQNRGGRSATIN